MLSGLGAQMAVYDGAMKPQTEPATKPLKPKEEPGELQKKSRGMTRKGFGEMLKRAITPNAAKPAAKLP
jgi:hypothetical protein